MDFDRMTVQNFKVKESSDFTSPQFAQKYLDKLPFTPMLAAGFNIVADFELPAIAVLWKNLKHGKIYNILNRFGGEGIQTISRTGLSKDGEKLLETTIIYSLQPDARVQLVITRLPEDGRVVRCNLNFEERGMEDRSKLAPFVSQSEKVLHGLTEIMEAFSKEM